jgi:hypothetical protein
MPRICVVSWTPVEAAARDLLFARSAVWRTHIHAIAGIDTARRLNSQPWYPYAEEESIWIFAGRGEETC